MGGGYDVVFGKFQGSGPLLKPDSLAVWLAQLTEHWLSTIAS